MKTINRILASAALLMGILAACTDLKDLDERVNTLESRITALEKVIPSLNGNVEALKGLLSAGTINSATQSGGVWTIVLNNGETLSLTQGSIGVGNAPVMSVDQDGYWMVNYGDGAQYIMNGDNKVLAIGTNGVTPLFGVDAEGYWTVSYDNGNTFSQVKGADDNPVSALPSGDVEDPYFDDVKLENNILTVTMKGGDTITIPVLSDFLCAIEAEGIQVFGYGETKPYNVSIKGVKSTMITAPTGWTASLSTPEDNKAVLSVTAPAAVKSTIADSGADVCILAFSEQNLATIAKIQVQLADAPAVVTPVANVTAGEATERTLAYNIATVNTTSWKYMLLKDSEPAPEAAKIATDGTEGTGTSLILQDLDPSTTYVLYVLPVNGEVQGAVTSAENTTISTVITDLYQAYLDGKEIEIAGVKYKKDVNGDPVLKTASKEADETFKNTFHQKESAIVFLEAEGENTFALTSVAEIKGNVAIVSRYTDKPATIAFPSNLKAINGSLAIENVIIDMAGSSSYFINNANSTADFDGMYFKNVKFTNIVKPILYANVATYGFKNVIVKDCLFNIAVGAQEKSQLFNFYKSTVLHTYKKIVFDNNIVYSDDAAHQIQIFNYDQNSLQTGSPWEVEVSICNNTIYNLPSNNGYFKFYQIASLQMNRNIFWADPATAVASYCMILYSASQDGTDIDTTDNIAYGLNDTFNWTIAHSNSKFKPAENVITKLDSTPFATADVTTGTFTPSAEYASYGAQR